MLNVTKMDLKNYLFFPEDEEEPTEGESGPG